MATLTQYQQTIDTESFWDTVANMYSQSTLTSHMADFEMDIVFKFLSCVQILLGVASFGVADGNRDPIQILNFIREQNKYDSENFEVLLNDISGEMLRVAEQNMITNGHGELQAHYVHNPVSQLIDVPSFFPNKNTSFIFGVYNARYIVESLELYRQNKAVIGNKFSLSALYLKEDLTMANKWEIVEESRSILHFDIDDHLLLSEAILLLMTIPNFYAYSISTEKNFVSHFFAAESLKKILESIFPNKKVAYICGDNADGHDNRRYIVNILENDGPTNYLVTMMNNVLGNIKFEEQQQSLKNLWRLF
jgi:hypothetical protein